MAGIRSIQEAYTFDDVLLIPLCPRCVEGIRGTHTAVKDPDWPETPPGHTIV